MAEGHDTDAARHRAPGVDIGVYESLLAGIGSLGWRLWLLAAAALTLILLVLVPPLSIEKLVVAPPQHVLTVALHLQEQPPDRPTFELHSRFLVDEARWRSYYSEEIVRVIAYTDRADFTGVELTGATVVAGGDGADNWLCSMLYLDPSTGLMAGLDPVQPHEPSVEEVGLVVTSRSWVEEEAASAYGLTVWKERNREELGQATGIECRMNHADVEANEAGDRWFSFTDVVILATDPPEYETGYRWLYDNDHVGYRQTLEPIVPRSWNDLTRPSYDDDNPLWIDDQLGQLGEATVWMPINVEPREALMRQYRDPDAALQNGLRIGLGWFLLGLWGTMLLTGILSRARALRR